MAKEILDTNIQRPAVGIVTDYSYEDQPNGNTFVLNGITETSSGDRKKISTEQSNAPCGDITSSYLPNGKCYTTDGRTIIFSVTPDGINSEIGIVDKNCNYTSAVNESGLGFTINHQIQATYRSRRGCEDVVYFTDGNGSMKYFNFSKPQDFYTAAYNTFLNNNSPGTFIGDKWDINKFNLFPAYQVPCFSKLEVITGGTLLPGTYNFAIQYLDSDLNPTNWIYSSQLVPIVQADLSGDSTLITGSSVLAVDSISGILNTTKSIRLTLSNLDIDYTYYRIAVISSVDSTGLISQVLMSPQFPISTPIYEYSGNNEGYSKITVDELSLGKIDIEVVQHLEQLENKLILANVKGKQVAYCAFQQAASKIVSNYIISETEEFEDGDPKYPNTYWDTEGYMGDEVYAMGVIYVFDDGLETPSFHIPGRSPGEYMRVTDKTIIPADDQTIISLWNQDLAPWYDNEDIYNVLPPSLKLKKWQVYDTSQAYSPSGVTASYGAMSYWQNKDAFYTNFSDCNGDDFWGEDACGVALLNTPIRHHKFPSRFKEPHVRGGTIFSGSTGLYLDVVLNTGQTFPGGGLTLQVNYDLNNVPDVYITTITTAQLPIQKFLIDQFAGDGNSIVITAISGTLTDPSNAAITTFSVYKATKSLSIQDNNIKRNLGIQFSNITYPDPRIVGHYFVRGKRDDQNRTVLDKGYCDNLRAKLVNGIEYTGFAYFNGDVNDATLSNYLLTPRFLFNKETLTGDYIKYENEATIVGDFVNSETIDGHNGDQDTKIETRSQVYGAIATNNGDHNFKVDKSIILDATSKSTTFISPTTPVYNLSWSNRLQVVHTTHQFTRPDKNMPYVAYKVDQNVHPVLSQIVYQRTHNCMLTPQDSNIVFGGDTFISLWNISNSLYRTQQSGILKVILSVILIAAAVVATIVTAGVGAPLLASAISAAGIAATAAGVESVIVITALVAGAIGLTGTAIQAITSEISGDLGALTFDDDFANASGRGVTLSSYVSYANELMTNLYTESEVNVGLRQTENHICGNYFGYGASGPDPANYFKDRWMYFDQSTNNYRPKGFCCPEIYHYNKDFSRQNLQSIYFPLPDTYDCCSDCSESHPNRVHYSQESFQEELSDNYKVFLPNDYRDIESEHGEITNLIKRNNNLFIHTSEALWALPQSQEERVTNELVTFIGTGEFFSIPPKKIVDDELGSVGSKHKWATLNTNSGILFVNEVDGEITIFDQKFTKLSEQGNQRWFKENLQDFFARQFRQLTNTIFPNQNNPANPFGVGIHSVYDKRYNRLIITKRDYLLLPAFTSGMRVVSSSNGLLPTGLSSGLLIFDLTTSKFLLTGNSTSSYTFVELNNTHYFQNKSWTLSYSLEDNAWTSWHSYIPNFYFYNHKDFYSLISTSNQIYKHNILGSFLTYYGVSYPHILEVVLKGDNPSTTKYWEDISLQTIAKQYDVDNKEFYDIRDITFNRFIAYNSRQTTGLQTLVPKDDFSDLNYLTEVIGDISQQVFITRKERDWNLNDLRDYRNNYNFPIFNKSWNSILGSYYIDKIIDQTNIDFNKDWTQLEVLRDKFIVLRFIFDNFTDVQLSTNYISDTSGTSMR